jgi:hypothetical protein
MITKAAWLTDIHLDWLRSPDEIDALARRVLAFSPGCVLLSGDMSLAPDLARYLGALAERLRLPVFFVLRNHDFYGSSIEETRAVARRLSAESPWLTWLSGSEPVALTATTGLIGHDGWGDGRLGSGARSSVVLSDFHLISELSRHISEPDGIPARSLYTQLNALGDEAARHIARVLPAALARFRQVLLVTHVPPFRESCWHESRISDDDCLPHFTCQAVGDVLLDIMTSHPAHELTVMCGHTHSPDLARIRPNLLVKTGGATYGEPAIQEVLTVE